MNEEIKEKLDLNPNNMNEIAKEAYYQLENYIFTLEKTQNNWKELKNIVEEEIKRKEEHFNFILQNYNPLKSDIKLQLEKDDLIISKLKDVLKDMQELEQGKDE